MIYRAEKETGLYPTFYLSLEPALTRRRAVSRYTHIRLLLSIYDIHGYTNGVVTFSRGRGCMYTFASGSDNKLFRIPQS